MLILQRPQASRQSPKARRCPFGQYEHPVRHGRNPFLSHPPCDLFLKKLVRRYERHRRAGSSAGCANPFDGGLAVSCKSLRRLRFAHFSSASPPPPRGFSSNKNRLAEHRQGHVQWRTSPTHRQRGSCFWQTEPAITTAGVFQPAKAGCQAHIGLPCAPMPFASAIAPAVAACHGVAPGRPGPRAGWAETPEPNRHSQTLPCRRPRTTRAFARGALRSAACRHRPRARAAFALALGAGNPVPTLSRNRARALPRLCRAAQ